MPLHPSISIIDPHTTCPPTTVISQELIIGLSVGIGTPLLAAVFFLAVCCCCVCIDQAKSRGGGDEEDGSGSRKCSTVAEGQDTPETARRMNTLLLRRSMNKGALIGPEMSPRSGTLVRQIGNREFIRMSSKQRCQVLEFPHGNICVLKDVGETNLGKTYMGEATGLRENELSTTIYIKSLRERAHSKLRQQFLAEITWSSGFDHPNILTLLAIATKDEPSYMIYEFLEYGALSDFLKSANSALMDLEKVLDQEDAASTHSTSAEDTMLGTEDLLGIGIQVAEGMEYLALKGIVHRDLAARNCHVSVMSSLLIHYMYFLHSHCMHVGFKPAGERK